MEVPGSDGLPGSERLKGTRACQKTGDRVQASGTVLRETRVIWRKLDCLNPNLQKVKSAAPAGKRSVTGAGPARESRVALGNFRDQERCPVRALKEMSGTPTSR